MNSLERCECCFKRRGHWYVIAESELMLCRSCATAVADEMGGTAERIED